MIIKSYYLLAKNSIESKKEARLEKAMTNYLKFVDLHPNSQYIAEAEIIYKDCERLKNERPKPK
jgi:TolA-binding protein